MFKVKDLTEEQKKQVEDWAAEGDQLADLQRKMNESFGLKLTYLDARFAVLDLGVQIIQEAKEVVKEEVPEKQAPVPQDYVDATVDTIVRPGFFASGKVVFRDGVRAEWGVDEMGQLSIVADDRDYQVDDEDMISFQEILRDKLKR